MSTSKILSSLLHVKTNSVSAIFQSQVVSDLSTLHLLMLCESTVDTSLTSSRESQHKHGETDLVRDSKSVVSKCREIDTTMIPLPPSFP